MSETLRTTSDGMVLVPGFLTVAQAAELLKLEPMTLRRYIYKKKGPRPTYFGRNLRIRADELMSWAAPGKRHPPASRKKT